MATKTRRWASPAEAADYLGGINVKTVQRLLDRNEFTRYRLGRLVRVDLDEVDAMLERSVAGGADV